MESRFEENEPQGRVVAKATTETQETTAVGQRPAEALSRDTRWARFRLLFVIALALIPAAAVLIAGSDGESGAAAMDLRVLSVKEHYPQALAIARMAQRRHPAAPWLAAHLRG
jgi:hypothetical protein